MLVRNPAAAGEQKLFIGKFDDYRRIHRNYIKSYKVLHEEVAAFSVLPENFIHQAEPVIEKFLEKHAKAINDPSQREYLQIITDFINQFHEFMDEATEMFTEHQALSDETYSYLQKVAVLDAKREASGISELEKDYMLLVPELQHLLNSLKAVKETVATTSTDLQALTPLWNSIQAKIA